MLRRLSIWLLALCWAVSADAQDGRWTIEPHAGLTLSQFIGDEANGCQMRPGLTCGISGRYRLADFMSASAGAEYVPRGSKLKFMDGHLRQDHLSLPILLHFHPFGYHVDFSLGICPTFSLHNTLIVNGERWNSEELFHGHDIMIPIGVTYTPNGRLTLGVRLSTGRKTMVKQDAHYRGNYYNLRGAMVNNSELTVSVGYRIRLR